jgi:RhtB (resistance to homoserine/threonine) family protein
MESTTPYLLALAGIGAVQLMAAMSPGPAFLVVTRISVGESRRAALGAAFGVATAALLWAVAATLGMHVLLAEAAWLYGALKLVGGLYLLWLGIQAWRHAAQPLAPATEGVVAMNAWEAWRLGFSTNLANPKVIVFFGSIFVTLFTPETPSWVRGAALIVVAVNESGWYATVALLFSSRPAQAAYRRAKRWIDRATGAVMMIFGLHLILSARS